ncbi:MAG: FG-GAP repeat protein [Ignavibacteria bacterium]|nr:FG-GAP repeat protein [Ignavibacteria bacterium]
MNNIADLTFVRSSGSLFGNAVSTAGDVNGDGYSDIIVGDFGYNSLRGAANLYFGGTAMMQLQMYL